MAKYREQPCESYVCYGECKKGREAEHNGYCQKCQWYRPRVRIKTENQKKNKLNKIMEKENDF